MDQTAKSEHSNESSVAVQYFPVSLFVSNRILTSLAFTRLLVKALIVFSASSTLK